MSTAVITCINDAIEQLWKPRRSAVQIHREAAVSDATAAHAWAQAFYALRSDSTGTREESAADQERIACLEAIITVLIEKNERVRQQLLASMQ